MSNSNGTHLLADNATELTALSGKEFADMVNPLPEGELILSLRMPMKRLGAETRKNHIRFKNALQEADQLLKNYPEHHEAFAEILSSLAPYAAEGDPFWSHQNEGLAITITSSGVVRAYQVPFKLEEAVFLDDTGHLTPLLRLVDPPLLYVLSLDLGGCKLYEGSPWAMKELEMSGVPLSLDEAMKTDDPEKSLQSHSSGGQNAIFHGHGATGDEEQKRRIQRWFEMLDKGLAAQLPDPNRNLILFGPESETGLFRKISQYHKLIDRTISHNPSHLSEQELQEKICAEVADYEDTLDAESLTHLADSIGQNKGSTDHAEIALAALDGRVKELFFRFGHQHYGNVDVSKREIEFHDTRQPGDHEMFDYAIRHAANTDAAIHLLDSEEDSLPGDAKIAASYRY